MTSQQIALGMLLGLLIVVGIFTALRLYERYWRIHVISLVLDNDNLDDLDSIVTELTKYKSFIKQTAIQNGRNNTILFQISIRAKYYQLFYNQIRVVTHNTEVY